MARQLNIRSDEAYDIAQRLAKKLGKTTTTIITSALREYERSQAPQPEVSPEEAERNFEFLMALSRETAKHAKPGATSDHSDFYDERGLPI